MTPENPLPGLGESRIPHGLMRRASEATLEALGDLGAMEPRHAARAAQLLIAADAIDQLATYGGPRKGTPLALLLREMREALDALPEPPAGAGDGWEELANELRNAAAGNTA